MLLSCFPNRRRAYLRSAETCLPRVSYAHYLPGPSQPDLARSSGFMAGRKWQLALKIRNHGSATDAVLFWLVAPDSSRHRSRQDGGVTCKLGPHPATDGICELCSKLENRKAIRSPPDKKVIRLTVWRFLNPPPMVPTKHARAHAHSDFFSLPQALRGPRTAWHGHLARARSWPRPVPMPLIGMAMPRSSGRRDRLRSAAAKLPLSRAPACWRPRRSAGVPPAVAWAFCPRRVGGSATLPRQRAGRPRYVERRQTKRRHRYRWAEY